MEAISFFLKQEADTQQTAVTEPEDER